MFFTSDKHKACFEEKIERYDAYDNPEYLALLYLLTSSYDIRIHFEDCCRYDFGHLYINKNALEHEWVTGQDARIIRLAFNLFTGGTPTDYDDPSERDRYSPFRIFSGLDSVLFEAAITGIRIKNRMN